MQDPIVFLRQATRRIYQDLLDAEMRGAAAIARVHPEQRLSATNLFHYLTLRCEDLRDLQDDLHNAGLSSLASSESHVLRQVQAVLEHLGIALPADTLSVCDFPTASRLLQQHATTLFGPKINPNIPHLMVTFDASLAADYAGVKALVQAGMNVARVNCAHDGPAVWQRMIENVRKAERATGHSCKVYLDLAGPKIRTALLGKGQKKGRLKLYENDHLWLAEANSTFDPKGNVVGCTLPGVVRDLQPGDRVLFDDGLIEAMVERSDGKSALLRISRISSAKPYLKPEKGINFPDTELSVRCLTEFDKSVIPFAVEHADLVGFSFLRQAEEVAELQQLLRRHDNKPIPLVMKIETFDAVQNLPALLLQGMAEPAFGVMIARGDLAVEIGFERLSEIQEEILWICEAAHAPVIWATQVLETLNKSGIATRSEVTDAARAAQAECVMLNKGKHMLTVLATLRDILHRSGGHHIKKRYVFRPLNIAERFLQRQPAQKAAPLPEKPLNSGESRRRSLRKSGTP